jgi:CrcB protein
MALHSDNERTASLLKYLVVGVGGFLGAIARYMLGTYIGNRYGVRFPYGTFVINMSGCFLIGLILTLLARTTASQYWRYLIPIGFIGAYTTFSTFEYETLRAVQDGQVMTGLLNVVLSVIVGYAAVWAGAALGRVFV